MHSLTNQTDLFSFSPNFVKKKILRFNMPKINQPKYLSALNFALKLHSKQMRKGTQIPYFFHLSSVSNHVIEIEETSFGCSGPISNPFNVVVIDAPISVIIGLDTSCVGDTLDYFVPFLPNAKLTL